MARVQDLKENLCYLGEREFAFFKVSSHDKNISSRMPKCEEKYISNVAQNVNFSHKKN